MILLDLGSMSAREFAGKSLVGSSSIGAEYGFLGRVSVTSAITSNDHVFVRL